MGKWSTPILVKSDARLESFKHKNALIVKVFPQQTFTVVDCDDVKSNMLVISRIEVIKSGMTRSQRKLQLANAVSKATPEKMIAFCEKFKYKILNSPLITEKPIIPVIEAQPTIIPADRPLPIVFEGDDKMGPITPYKPIWRRKSFDKKEDKRISVQRYKSIRFALNTLSIATNENYALRIGANASFVLKNGEVIITAYSGLDLKKKIESMFSIKVMEEPEVVEERLNDYNEAVVQIMVDALEEQND